MKTSEKPRARPYEPSNPCIAWICNGYKGRLFHVQFGSSWWEACREWHETEPHEQKYAADMIDFDDCPF